jgi:N12 class adenine-specific DNA methylase
MTWPPSSPAFGPAFTPRDRRTIRAAEAAIAKAAAAERKVVDLVVVAEAFRRAIEIGAPGVAPEIRNAIVVAALIRLRHTLKTPAVPK